MLQSKINPRFKYKLKKVKAGLKDLQLPAQASDVPR
jgi:hypothetical protein